MKPSGVELIAEVLPQILGLYPQVQAILCGLCSDLPPGFKPLGFMAARFGVMSQDLLRRVMSAFPGAIAKAFRHASPCVVGRLCFLSERFELSNELRRGVHLLLSPHVAEPVGQMDVEMGFLGATWTRKPSETHCRGALRGPRRGARPSNRFKNDGSYDHMVPIKLASSLVS